MEKCAKGTEGREEQRKSWKGKRRGLNGREGREGNGWKALCQKQGRKNAGKASRKK